MSTNKTQQTAPEWDGCIHFLEIIGQFCPKQGPPVHRTGGPCLIQSQVQPLRLSAQTEYLDTFSSHSAWVCPLARI